MRPAALAACVVLAALSAPAARASILYGSVNEDPGSIFEERIYVIDQAAGLAGPLPEDTGFNSPLDLTSNWTNVASFQLWAPNALTNQLIEIEPATGAATAVGSFGTPFNMNSLAYDVTTGRMFGTDAIDQLFEINPATGAASSPIGLINFGVIDALAFDLGGTLYGVSNQTGDLLTIKLDTGLASVVGPTGLTDVNDLAFRPEDGALFAVSGYSDQIYTLNKTTGAATAVGPYDQGLGVMVGLAFGPIPEPGTLSLLAVGAMAVLRRRQRS